MKNFTNMRASIIATLAVAALISTWAPNAGAKVKPVAGGANQRASVEGCINQTLFDGFWRFKVKSAVLGTEPGSPTLPAWGVAIELRNARTQDTSPAYVGVGSPQVVLADGTVLNMSTDSQIAYNSKILYLTIPPGGSAHGTFYFRTDNNTSKADKLLLPINPSNTVYRTSLGYPVKNPSFRVHLNCRR